MPRLDQVFAGIWLVHLWCSTQSKPTGWGGWDSEPGIEEMCACRCECSKAGGRSRGATETSVSSQAHRNKMSFSPIPKIHWISITKVSALRLISVFDVCSVEGNGEKTTGEQYSGQGCVDWSMDSRCGYRMKICRVDHFPL